jgi:hypothetical protein
MGLLTSEAERRAVNIQRYVTLRKVTDKSRRVQRNLELLAKAILIIVIIIKITLTMTTETTTVAYSFRRS